MTVTLSRVQTYVGAEGGFYDAVLTECIAEAVALLSSYVRHLRVTGEDGTTRGVTVTAESGSYTWADNRDQAGVPVEDLVPLEVLDRATVEVSSDLFARRNAPNGVVNQQFSGGDGPAGGAVRINRDPMTPAYPLLARWAVPF